MRCSSAEPLVMLAASVCFLARNFARTALRSSSVTACAGIKIKPAFLSNPPVHHRAREHVAKSLDVADLVPFHVSGADMVLTKSLDVKVFAKHVKAWKISDKKFVPMTNVAGVKCTNPGWGI